jgi:hypothetical protein
MLMRFVSLGFATLASGRDVTGSGSCIYDKGYYLMLKSYSSIVVKFTTKVEPHQSLCRTIRGKLKKLKINLKKHGSQSWK